MNCIRLLLVAIIWAGAAAISPAQELNCTVEINTDQLQNTGKDVFNTLQEAISEYMNTTKFSQAQIAANEKIECRLFLTVASYSDDGTVTGNIQVQSIRPVYNTSYTTTLLNFKDSKIDFTYQQGEPLVFSENSMESQLTAILNFYAYLILALDFDSFSPHGGDPFWERLKLIVQQGQSAGEIGWKAFEDTKNRAAVLSAYTDPSTSGLRDLIYQYHRTGLDEMSQSPDKGRAKITESLDALSKVYQTSSMSVGLSMFKDAKLDELVNLYSKSPSTERERVYELLYPIYPTEGTRLDKIKKGAVK